MPGALKPTVLKPVDWMRLIQEHGGVRAQVPASPKGGGDNPLISGAGAGAGASVVQFNDGTSLTVRYDGTSQSLIVEDWGTVGQVLDAQATQAAKSQLTPAEQEAEQLALESARLTNEQKRRDLAAQPQKSAGAMESAFRDLDQTLTYLQQQYAGGKLSEDQFRSATQQARRAFSDTLAGSTGYQRATSAANYRQGNAQMGAGLLNQRVSSGTSILNNLLGNTMDAVKLGVGPGNFDPYALAKGWVTDLGGGQANYDLASQMLQGAVGDGGTTDPLNPAYWYGTPQDPGDLGIPPEMDDEDAASTGASSGPLPGGTAPTQSAPYMANDPSTWW